MLGISFVLLNNVVRHLGPAATGRRGWRRPRRALIYLLLSLAAFGWLVRDR